MSGRTGSWRHVAEIGGAFAVCGALATTAAVIIGNPQWLLSGIVGALGAVAAMRLAGIRGLLAGLCFFLVSPGVLGESSLVLTMLGLMGLAGIAATYRPQARVQLRTLIIYGVIFAALAIGLLSVGGGFSAAAHIAACGVAVLAASRPDFVINAVRGLACLLGALALSYAVTLMIGFSPYRLGMGTARFDGRKLEFYPPFTVATAGPPFVPETRRFSPLVGEPGLTLYFLVPILALLVAARLSPRVRIPAIAAVLVTVLFTQSTGSYIAIAGGLVVLGMAHLAFTRGQWGRVAVLAGVAVVAAVPALYYLIRYKALLAPESVTDRGVFDAGDSTVAALGNVNLIVTFSNGPVLAVTVTCALIALGLLAGLRPAGLFAFAIFAVTAVFSQPSHWQTGGWLLLAMSLTLIAQWSDDAARPRHAVRKVSGGTSSSGLMSKVRSFVLGETVEVPSQRGGDHDEPVGERMKEASYEERRQGFQPAADQAGYRRVPADPSG